MKSAMQKTLAGSLLASLARGKGDRDPQALKIALGFAGLAGSEDNILTLVDALRLGIPAELAFAPGCLPQNRQISASV